MLQFNAIVCIMSTKFTTSRLSWRFTALFTSNRMIVASEFSTTAFKQNHAMQSIIQKEAYQKNFKTLKAKVQKSLQSNTSITSEIQKVNTIDELLKLMNVPVLSKDEISTVMKAIISWVNENNRIRKKNEIKNVDDKTNSADEKSTLENNLMTTGNVLELKYKDLSTSSMIQEVYKFARQKKRHIKDIYYLLGNIRDYNEKLTEKHCSILLYSMATLRCPDMKLCDRISKVLAEDVKVQSFIAIKNALQSMAMLRYKNVEFLKYTCKTVLNNEMLHPEYVTSILRSLAILGFVASETDTVIEKYMPLITLDSLGTDNWLNYVWCLALLNNFQKPHIESVLSEQFIKTLHSADTQLDILQQVKLLNINGAAKHLIKDYHGPLLENGIIQNGIIEYSKEKQEYVTKLKKTLNFMSESRDCFRTSVNTGMGFLLDAECYLDSNLNFIDLKTALNNEIHKLAIIINDYNVYCYESEDVIGIVKFQKRLLSHSGYEVLPICYKNFGLEDNLVKLTTLLQSRIKLSSK